MLFFDSIYYFNVEHTTKDLNWQTSKKDEIKYDFYNIQAEGLSFAEPMLESRFRDISLLNRIGYSLNVNKLKLLGEHVTDLDNMSLSDDESRRCHLNGFRQMEDATEYPTLIKQLVYFIEKYEVFISFDDIDYNDRHLSYRIYMQQRGNICEVVDDLTNRGILNKPKSVEPEPKIGLLISREHGLDIAVTPLNVPDVGNLDVTYGSGFTEISNQILSTVKDITKTGLLIFHGTAGTGKTTCIKWLSGQTHRKFIYIPSYMVNAITEPSFMELFLRLQDTVFVIEDAEESLRHRVSGGSSVVSTLLNLTDGILADTLNCQFICTFNTELENIDPALLRPGRLLVRHEFDRLTIEESKLYLATSNVFNFEVDREMTLAELSNVTNKTISNVEGCSRNEKTPFGFNGVK